MSLIRFNTSDIYTADLTYDQEPKILSVKQVNSFGDVIATEVKLYPEPYRPSEKLIDAVNLSITLGRPLLLQGEPGCGKTRLAYSIAYELGLPLERCTVKSTSRAQDLLYSYEAIARLYDAQLGDKGPISNGQLRFEDIRNYITLRPLGKAIAAAQYGQRSVVLIDEIDKADIDFPNDLLWELNRMEFEVSEEPSVNFGHSSDNYKESLLRPIVVVTHNEEKALPDAFLRRCIFHYIEFPEDNLEEILQLHRVDNGPLSAKVIDLICKLRSRDDLIKKPGISELLDWVGYLDLVNAPIEQLESFPYIGAILKNRQDQI